MVEMIRTLYFDTNVFTQLLERCPADSYNAILQRVLSAGAEIVLSPANIIEILQTRDQLQRERLIFLAQCLCSERLLVDIESIVVHFIAERSARHDLKPFVLPNGYHEGRLADAWRATQADKRRTLLFSRKDLQRFDVIRRVFSLVHAHLRRGGSHFTALESLSSESRAFNDVYEALRDAAARSRKAPAPPASELSVDLKESIMFVLMLLLCAEVTLFPERVLEFWDVIGITNIYERFQYCMTHFLFVLEEGPLIGIGAVLGAQSHRSYDSGNTFDCFHLAYSPHVEVIYTHDTAMIEIAESFKRSEKFARIKPYEEFHRVFVAKK